MISFSFSIKQEGKINKLYRSLFYSSRKHAKFFFFFFKFSKFPGESNIKIGQHFTVGQKRIDDPTPCRPS